MLGGFTFRGVHSSTYNVRQTPANRVLSPLKRRSVIQIPGRSKAFIQEDGSYDPRRESIQCSYQLPYGANIYEEVRNIAGWLNGVGELTYDYEPNLHYNAFVSSPPPTVIALQYAAFQIEFTMVPPFAYETPVLQTQLISGEAPNNVISVLTDGTVSTPVRIVITNNTDKVINELKIYHRYVEE